MTRRGPPNLARVSRRFYGPVEFQQPTEPTVTDGILIDGTPARVQGFASIYPAKGETVDRLESGIDVSNVIEGDTEFADIRVRVRGSQRKATRIVKDGLLFEVVELGPWRGGINAAVVYRHCNGGARMSVAISAAPAQARAFLAFVLASINRPGAISATPETTFSTNNILWSAVDHPNAETFCRLTEVANADVGEEHFDTPIEDDEDLALDRTHRITSDWTVQVMVCMRSNTLEQNAATYVNRVWARIFTDLANPLRLASCPPIRRGPVSIVPRLRGGSIWESRASADITMTITRDHHERVETIGSVAGTVISIGGATSTIPTVVFPVPEE